MHCQGSANVEYGKVIKYIFFQYSFDFVHAISNISANATGIQGLLC